MLVCTYDVINSSIRTSTHLLKCVCNIIPSLSAVATRFFECRHTMPRSWIALTSPSILYHANDDYSVIVPDVQCPLVAIFPVHPSSQHPAEIHGQVKIHPNPLEPGDEHIAEHSLTLFVISKCLGSSAGTQYLLRITGLWVHEWRPTHPVECPFL